MNPRQKRIQQLREEIRKLETPTIEHPLDDLKTLSQKLTTLETDEDGTSAELYNLFFSGNF